jgi:hypothetical protein
MTQNTKQVLHTPEEIKQLKAELISHFFKIYKGALHLKNTPFKSLERRFWGLPHINAGDIPQLTALELIKSMGRAEAHYERNENKPFPWFEVVQNSKHPERLTIEKKAMYNAREKIVEVGLDIRKKNGKTYALPIISKDISDFEEFLQVKANEEEAKRNPIVEEVLDTLGKAPASMFEIILDAGGYGEENYSGYLSEFTGLSIEQVNGRRTRMKDSINKIDFKRLSNSKQVKDLEKKAEKLENALNMEEDDLQVFIANEFKQDSPLSQRIDLTVDVSTVKEICEHLKNGTPISRASLYKVSSIIIKELNQTEAKLDGLKPC